MGHDTSDGSPFDLDQLQHLVEMMEKHDLRMVKLRKGDERWVLRRGPQQVLSSLPASSFAHAPVAAPPAPPTTSANPVAAPANSAVSAGTPIKSPTVGTYYSSPSPGDPAFVKVGDRVTPEKIVCILEAMKVFNQIPAGVSGTVSKVFLKDGDAVDFGQTLFLVTPD